MPAKGRDEKGERKLEIYQVDLGGGFVSYNTNIYHNIIQYMILYVCVTYCSHRLVLNVGEVSLGNTTVLAARCSCKGIAGRSPPQRCRSSTPQRCRSHPNGRPAAIWLWVTTRPLLTYRRRVKLHDGLGLQVFDPSPYLIMVYPTSMLRLGQPVAAVVEQESASKETGS